MARNGAVSCPWSRLFFLDPLAVEALGAEFQDLLMPEPVEQWDPTPSDEARSRLGLPTSDLLITLVGSITRKGAVELASAFATSDVDTGVDLAFIGPIDEGLPGRSWRRGSVGTLGSTYSIGTGLLPTSGWRCVLATSCPRRISIMSDRLGSLRGRPTSTVPS